MFYDKNVQKYNFFQKTRDFFEKIISLSSETFPAAPYNCL